MNKKMRELQDKIQSKVKEAESFMEGDTKDLAKAEALMAEVKELQREFDIEAEMEKAKKAGIPADAQGKTAGEAEKADGFEAMAKKLNHQSMTDAEKAMISGDNAANGENYLVPEDVRLEIKELRKTYVSARSIVTVETTDA